MKILKNFKILPKEGRLEEYYKVEIRMNDSEVFVDLPVCIIDFNQEFEEPMLLGYNSAGLAKIIERSELELMLEKTQIVYFNNKDGLLEITDKKTEVFTRLPKEDDPNKYEYDFRDGDVFIIEKIEEFIGE